MSCDVCNNNYSLAKPHPLCATPTLCRWVWLSEIIIDACSPTRFTLAQVGGAAAGGVRQGSRGTYLLIKRAEFHTFSRL